MRRWRAVDEAADAAHSDDYSRPPAAGIMPGMHIPYSPEGKSAEWSRLDESSMPLLAGMGYVSRARVVQMAMVPRKDDRLEYELSDDDGAGQRVA
jgi:hypothetical protein